jgi:hypothetical protein
MSMPTSNFLKVCTLSIALLGSTAVILAVSLPDAAYANNGNGKGKGNGNGGGGGNGNGNGNGNGGGNGGGNGNGGNGAGNGGNGYGGGAGTGPRTDFSSKADKSHAVIKKARKAAPPAPTAVGKASTGKIKPKQKDEVEDGLAHPSELGALNAAHANERALENASPNSRVGRIAIYRDTVLAGDELEADLAEKEALLKSLPLPRDQAVIADELEDAKTEVEDLKTALSALEARVPPPTPDELQTARDLVGDAEEEARLLEEEQKAAVAHEDLQQEVAELEQKVLDQPEIERSALEAAANKEVTDEVEATVRALLGLTAD